MHPALPPSRQKQLILANQISISFLSLIFILFLITLLVNHSLLRACTTAFGMLTFLLVLWLNHLGQGYFSRILMSFLFPVIVMSITTLPKWQNPGLIPVVEYFQHRFLLLATLCLPLLLLDRRKNRLAYWLSLAFILLCLISLDALYHVRGVGVYDKYPDDLFFERLLSHQCLCVGSGHYPGGQPYLSQAGQLCL
ncbi:MAG: hypothetical protein HC913_10715 [Microscillaceae bacterium]|nr:hypothetical protein [Microscillaceae bacterium]